MGSITVTAPNYRIQFEDEHYYYAHNRGERIQIILKDEGYEYLRDEYPTLHVRSAGSRGPEEASWMTDIWEAEIERVD